MNAQLATVSGPQVAPAIALSKAVRERHPDVPIVWGGYFPTLYPDAALAAPYVDVVVRGPGEATLAGLLATLGGTGGAPSLASVAGISWKESGRVVHNTERPLGPPDALPPLPYELLGDVSRFLQPTYLGRRTAVHQAAIGCRHRCSFCGVVSMFDGRTLLPPAERVATANLHVRGAVPKPSLSWCVSIHPMRVGMVSGVVDAARKCRADAITAWEAVTSAPLFDQRICST